MQVIHAQNTDYWQVVDLSSLPSEEREHFVHQLVQTEAACPFDLERGPLLRVRLLRLDEQEHVLLLTMHHIVSDGWSGGLLVHELSTLYTAFVNKQSSPLPALPIQYADFALWQRHWLQGEVLERQVQYWREHLAAVPPLELPIDHPRPAQQTFRGARQSLLLPTTVQEQLKALSQREGVTLFMTVLAAFQVLLARYSGQSDLAIGTPIANRTHAEVEGLIGFFVNTLVLRSDLSGNPPFVQVLKRVREVALGAYVHQDVPFEKIVEVLQPERDLSRSPLFQVMFVLQNIPASSAPALPGLRLMQIEREVQTSKFDLTLTVTETAQGLHCLLEYNTDLFEALTVTRLLSCWQILLEGIVAAPQQRIAALPLLTPVERQFIIHDLNRTQRTFPTDRCIHTLFEEQVERTPDAVAVVFADQQITYLALDRRASRVAQHLRSLGVGPEVLVGICMERSVAWIVGVLAILKAGGAYVPLDPNAPKERLVGILEDTQLRILLVQEHLRERFAALPGTHVSTDAEWDLFVQEENPLMVTVTRAAVPSNLAYVIYTSGSTGRPKGVPITHENVVSSLFARLACYREPIASYLLLSPFFFDSSVAGLFWTLSQGGRLVVPSETFQQDLSEVPALLERAAISHMLCIPSLYAFVLSSASARQLAALRVVIVAGEACPVSLVKQHRQSVPQVTLCNEYGPTEGTVWSSVYQDHAEELTSRIPIGDPIATVQIYLLDPMLQPVPMGVAGELYIAGSGLARGYLNAASLTAEKFLPHPFAERVGERVYRTGDRARYNAQGSIEFLGRVDDQVKLRGYRIELSEIELPMRQHHNVQDCVFVLREDGITEPKLLGYVVMKPGSPTTSGELRTYLKQHVPDYMVPANFILLAALPLTPNGKVDYRALPIQEEAYEEETFVAPRNTVEYQLRDIWEELLMRHPVGVEDNFFDLGGHSILAVRLVSAIRKQFGVNLALPSLFKYQTIAALAAILRQHLPPERRSVLVGLQPIGSKPPLFCVHPIGGNVFHYIGLARLLGNDQPFYGLQMPDLEGKEERFTTLEGIATDYIVELQTVQPEGPYLLSGWSTGGVIAFEMAQQLKQQGQAVALLALFDSMVPTSYSHTDQLTEASGMDDEALTKYILDQFDIPAPNPAFYQDDSNVQLMYAFEQAMMRRFIPLDMHLDEFRMLARMRKMNFDAVYSYKPQIYPGQITLFRATEGDAIIDVSETTHPLDVPIERTLTRGWDQLALEGIKVYKVAGNHNTLFSSTNVPVLASSLRDCLDEIISEV